MADQFTVQKRSEIMSKVKSKNTSIEVKFRKELWRRGLRYHIHSKLPGTPDIVFPKIKTAIFIDGCFWHSCPICKPTMPSSNAEYWKNKINKNIERSSNADRKLSKMGWQVIHVWEHQIKRDFKGSIDSVIKAISQKRELL